MQGVQKLPARPAIQTNSLYRTTTSAQRSGIDEAHAMAYAWRNLNEAARWAPEPYNSGPRCVYDCLGSLYWRHGLGAQVIAGEESCYLLTNDGERLVVTSHPASPKKDRPQSSCTLWYPLAVGDSNALL